MHASVRYAVGLWGDDERHEMLHGLRAPGFVPPSTPTSSPPRADAARSYAGGREERARCRLGSLEPRDANRAPVAVFFDDEDEKT